MCGLVGHSGSTAPDLNILKILGIYNVSRGKHSCGIAVNNKIRKHASTKDENFQDMLKYWEFPEVTGESNNVIIHTRHATVGAHTEKNAHPFGFKDSDEDEDDDYAFIGAHNGSLAYDWDKEGNLLTQEVFKMNPDLKSVDSKGLLFRIFLDDLDHPEDPFKVLREYKGDAALLFMFKDRPNVLYAWKGAAGGEIERPLHYLQVKNGRKQVKNMYLCSEPEPLAVAFNHKIEVHEVPNNTLLEITEGVITNQWEFVRGDNKKRYTYTTPAASRVVTHTTSRRGLLGGSEDEPLPSSRNSRISDEGDNDEGRHGKTYKDCCAYDADVDDEDTVQTPAIDTTTYSSSVKDTMKELLVFEPSRDKGNGRVVYRGFRYWYNGHKMHGLFAFEKRGGLLLDNDQTETLSPTDVSIDTDKMYKGYFWHGIRVKNGKAFEELKEMTGDLTMSLVSMQTFDPLCYVDYGDTNTTRHEVTTIGTFYYNGKKLADTAQNMNWRPKVFLHPHLTIEYRFIKGKFKGLNFIKDKNGEFDMITTGETENDEDTSVEAAKYVNKTQEVWKEVETPTSQVEEEAEDEETSTEYIDDDPTEADIIRDIIDSLGTPLEEQIANMIELLIEVDYSKLSNEEVDILTAIFQGSHYSFNMLVDKGVANILWTDEDINDLRDQLTNIIDYVGLDIVSKE